MNLYLLTTSGLGDFYLVAKSSNDAQNLLKKLLDEAGYGISDCRKVINIRIVAAQLEPSYSDRSKMNFTSGNNLIIDNQQ